MRGLKALNVLLVILFWAGFIWLLAVIGGQFHFKHKPTADELYGCTVAQQAPNGECQ